MRSLAERVDSLREPLDVIRKPLFPSDEELRQVAGPFAKATGLTELRDVGFGRQAARALSPRKSNPIWWTPQELAGHTESRTVIDTPQYGKAAGFEGRSR